MKGKPEPKGKGAGSHLTESERRQRVKNLKAELMVASLDWQRAIGLALSDPSPEHLLDAQKAADRLAAIRQELDDLQGQRRK